MKIKEIANNIELHKAEDGLALMSNNKVLLQGFTDIGTLANGLVPIIYYKQQQFKYLDTDTLEIIHKVIDVCPNLIRVDTDTFLKY